METIYKIIYVAIVFLPTLLIIWNLEIKKRIKQSTWFIFSGLSFLVLAVVDLLHDFFQCTEVVFLGSAQSCHYSFLFSDISWLEVWDIGYGIFATLMMVSLGLGLFYNWINEGVKDD